MRVWLKKIVLALVVLFVAIQFVRPSRTNPPINPNLEIGAVHPMAPDVESIFTRSCNDCHSNRTVWPWYSEVAPSSWLVAGDVNEGRSKMNLSEWATYPAKKRSDLLKDMCEEVSRGKMPMGTYLLMHPVARLTPADVNGLCQWTKATERSLSAQNE
jgi:hypothetical protein